ncbi:phosphotransferase [Stackebrandtia soli]|uniref:phosphotransferase n=1 Tax=Stackebrandtia soli TaxID=1892856 RepID=UPI0039EC6F2B
MTTRFGVPVPYEATAVRIGVDELPADVRAEIAAQIGGPIASVRMAGGGFSGGFAAIVTAETGRRMFVKASGPDLPFVLNAYTAEAHISALLPDEIPAPRLQFSSQVDEWVVLGFEAIDGKAPRIPISPDEWTLMLRAWETAADALTPIPASLRDYPLPNWATEDLSGFQRFTATASGDISPTIPERFATHVDELAALDSHINAAVTADAVMHGDLRPDNMVLRENDAVICDWNWPCVGAPWFDTVALLVPAHAEGHDADGMFWKHSTSAGVDGEQLDTVLAAIAGYYLAGSQEPPPYRVSPHIRAHQRWSALATLDWLANRRGW